MQRIAPKYKRIRKFYGGFRRRNFSQRYFYINKMFLVYSHNKLIPTKHNFNK